MCSSGGTDNRSQGSSRKKGAQEWMEEKDEQKANEDKERSAEEKRG